MHMKCLDGVKYITLFFKSRTHSTLHWWIWMLPPLYNILCHVLPQSAFFGDTHARDSHLHTQTLTLTTGPYNYAPEDPVKTCHIHGRHKAASIISPSCRLLDFIFLFMWLFTFIIIFSPTILHRLFLSLHNFLSTSVLYGVGLKFVKAGVFEEKNCID